MNVIYERCCGMDVHKNTIVACLIKGKKKEIRNFSTMTFSLLELIDWLKGADCQCVAMEATGSYWKPIYNLLEMEDINTLVVNAQHIKAVPGRKTDVKDSEWIADLLRHGLLKGSFIPKREQRELKELVRYRRSIIQERARELNPSIRYLRVPISSWLLLLAKLMVNHLGVCLICSFNPKSFKESIC